MCSVEPCGIRDLPYELLVEIFTFLSPKELVESTPDVCRVWREAFSELKTWKNKVYCPDAYDSHEEMIKLLERMGYLQGLILKVVVQNRTLYSIAQNCPLLRTLVICLDQPITSNFLCYLVDNCQYLEEVWFRLSEHCYKGAMENIAKLVHLKKLVIAADCQEEPLSLRPIADGCPSLKSIVFKFSPIGTAEFAYFIEKKANQLESISIKCRYLDECALPYISFCRGLKDLEIECICWVHRIDSSGLLLIRDMESVQSLTLCSKTLRSLCDDTFGGEEEMERKMIVNILKCCRMKQLKELRFQYMYHYKKELAETISQYCPQLTGLYFEEVSGLRDDSVALISTLPQLERLSLKGSAITDVSIYHLSKCVKLRYLDLSHCFRIKEAGMRKLLYFTNLRYLLLDYCNLHGFPFTQITLNLKGLRFLSINSCMNIDRNIIEKFCSLNKQVKVQYTLPDHWRNLSLQFREY